MPTGEEIKERFLLDYSFDLIELLRKVSEKDILKRDDGNMSVDFIDLIVYNIDIEKYVNKKNLSK